MPFFCYTSSLKLPIANLSNIYFTHIAPIPHNQLPTNTASRLLLNTQVQQPIESTDDNRNQFIVIAGTASHGMSWWMNRRMYYI